MSSLRRINSSRANGARSRGPVTPQGKERSSANALRHGLLAKCIVLENESSERFDDLVTQHIERFAPADALELGMIEEMAVAQWRLHRARAMEDCLMEKAIRNQPPGDEAARSDAAFAELAASPELTLLHRYEAHLLRIYQGTLDNLALLRTVPVSGAGPRRSSAKLTPPLPISKPARWMLRNSETDPPASPSNAL